MISDNVRQALRTLIKEKKWDEAQKALADESKNAHESPELLYYQGLVFLTQGKRQEALTTLGYAMRQAIEQDQFVLAMASAARLEALSPSEVGLRISRADLYISMGLDKAAYEYLLREFESFRLRNDPHAIYLLAKKIVSLDEESLDLALIIAKILAHLEQKGEARRIVENVIFALQGRGNYDEATRIQIEYGKLYEEP
jgi:predicted Zn-dependent protease